MTMVFQYLVAWSINLDLQTSASRSEFPPAQPSISSIIPSRLAGFEKGGDESLLSSYGQNTTAKTRECLVRFR